MHQFSTKKFTLKRLTANGENGPHLNCENCPKKGRCHDSLDCVAAVVPVLAAYEETGYSPEEILGMFDELCRKCTGYKDFKNRFCPDCRWNK